MIVKIELNQNGSHANQSTTPPVLPPGYAVLPAELMTPNFPFGQIEVEEIDGVPTVTKWTPLPIPQPEPVSAARLRENAYDTDARIPWDGELLTVTQAAQKWQYYAAEGSARASELQEMIAAAKAEIRVEYPDEPTEDAEVTE